MSKTDDAKHVLVINDTPEILDLFRELLEEAGYRVSVDRFTLALDKQLAETKRLKPDLVVLDYIIGAEGLGWQFLQLLKMDRETRPIPVLICTAAVQQVESLRPHLEELGVAVVLKPFDIDVVLDQIAKAWDKVDAGQLRREEPGKPA